MADLGGRGRAWLRSLRSRKLAWPWRALLWSYAGFLLAMNLVINLPILPALINPPDKSAVVSWSWGFSVFPGWAWAHNFYLRVEDDNMQFGLRVEDVHFWCDPRAFAHQTFKITSVSGDGAVVRMRFKRTPEDLAREGPDRIAALPPISGFDEIPRKGPPSPPFDGDSHGIWTVEISGVSARAREFWIEGLRYDGEAYAFGAFRFQPMTYVQVDGHLAIQGGDLTYGDHRVGSNLAGRLDVDVEPFVPFKEPGAKPVRFVIATLDLDGELQNARFLNAALRNTPAPAFASSPGRFSLKATLDRGKLAPGSEFQLRASDWQLSKGQYRAGGNYAQMNATIDAARRLSVDLALGPYQVDAVDLGKELFDGEGLQLRLSSQRLDLLDDPLQDLGFGIEIEAARVPDLTVINAYLESTRTVELLSGSGDLSGAFESPSTGSGHGHVNLSARKVAVRVARLQLTGDLQCDAQLAGVASNSRDLGILGRDELEAQAKLVGQVSVSTFRASAQAPLAVFALDAEVTLHPLLATEARGAEVLHHLSGELKLRGSVPGLTFLNSSLAASGLEIAGGRGQLDLDARLSHGVLGRASSLSFAAKEIAVSGHGFRGQGGLYVEAHVDETKNTPRATGSARLRGITLGTSELPSLVQIDQVALTAQSAEIDLVALSAGKPEAHLEVHRLRVPNLGALADFLPKAARVDSGRAEASLRAVVPLTGTGRIDATFRADQLASRLALTGSKIQWEGAFEGSTAITGLAEAPWEPALLARSHLDIAAQVSGQAHLAATAPEGRSSGHLAFEAQGASPATALEGGSASQLIDGSRLRARVTGALDDLAYLNHFLAKSPLRVRGQGVSLDATLETAGRTLAPGSTLHAASREILVGVGPLWTHGALSLDASLGEAGPQRGQLTVAGADLSVQTRLRDQTLATGGRLAFSLRTPTFDLHRLFLESVFEGNLQGLRLPDLARLAGLLPDLRDLQLTGGSATLAGTLSHPSENRGEGHLLLSALGAKVTVGGHPITSDLTLDARLRALADAGEHGKPLLRSLDLGDTTLNLDDVELAKDHGWWAHARVVRGELRFGETGAPPSISTDLTLEARDGLPVIHLLGPQLGLPGLFDGLLAFSHLRASAALELRGDQLTIPAFEVKGDHLELKGRALLARKHTRGDFLFDLGPLSIGIDVRDQHTGVQLVGATSWYRERQKAPLDGPWTEDGR